MFDRISLKLFGAWAGMFLLVPGATAVRAQAVQTPVPNAPAPPALNATGVISGTVLDTNHDVVQSASIILQFGNETRTATSGGDGQFVFDSLTPGPYQLTVTAPQMGTYSSGSIHLVSGGAIILPPIILSVTADTSVTVTADKEQLSVEQVQIAESQRVFGVIPNFYSSYDWNAPPMLAKQKFHLAIRSLIDPVSFLAVAGIAGAEQYQNIFPAYGSGFEGYAKRYGAELANHTTSDLLGGAVYPAIFHQDPRYFYKGKGSFISRSLYAISTAFIARSDSGRWIPNYSGILGNFTSAAISNLYYPASDRGATLIVYNGLANIGADAATDLIREFILKGITSHASRNRNGQP